MRGQRCTKQDLTPSPHRRRHRHFFLDIFPGSRNPVGEIGLPTWKPGTVLGNSGNEKERQPVTAPAPRQRPTRDHMKKCISTAVISALIPVQVYASVVNGVRGDIDGSCGAPAQYRSGCVNIADAVAAAKILTGQYTGSVNPGADVNGDGRMGIEEMLYVVHTLSHDYPYFIDRKLPDAVEGETYEAIVRCEGDSITVKDLPSWLEVKYSEKGRMFLSGTPGYTVTDHNKDGRHKEYGLEFACEKANEKKSMRMILTVHDTDRKIERKEL